MRSRGENRKVRAYQKLRGNGHDGKNGVSREQSSRPEFFLGDVMNTSLQGQTVLHTSDTEC